MQEANMPKKLNGRDFPGVGRQEIAGNPLTDEEVAMFEMFEREGWPHEKRLAYILDQVTRDAKNRAAKR